MLSAYWDIMYHIHYAAIHQVDGLDFSVVDGRVTQSSSHAGD